MIPRTFAGVLCLLLATVAVAAERAATPVSAITVKPGFEVELLRSSQPDEGSWISMTFDAKGRIIVGDDVSGLRVITLGKTPETTTVERLPGTEAFKHCRGVLYAHNSLYAVSTNGEGIHRLQDLDGDGTYETVKLIVPLVYNSRYGHGANQMRLGRDGNIYVAIGNDVLFPEKRSPDSPYLETHNDWMLPNPRDGAPDPRSGFILKMSPDGEQLTVLNGGLRNQVDVDYNEDGELFTWDADMEWDVGLPWYRPTRINHIVSGGEYGWRNISGKWPAWFPDSLPANLETGLGSPTGIVFGHHGSWPNGYRDALYAADWQHGRLLKLDLFDQGATYGATSEVLAEGSPLNICDLEFGPDGELYFITGGRGSQSGLYRIRLTKEGRAKAPLSASRPAGAAEARKLRHQLEALHTRQDAAKIPFIWEHLGSEDLWIRFAARVALERQPVEGWRDRVKNSPDSRARQTALMALAHKGEPADQPVILQGLQGWIVAEGDLSGLLWKLRTLQLTLIRQGHPQGEGLAPVWKILETIPDSDRFEVNWLLGELLVALQSPKGVELLVQKLATAGTQEEQVQSVKMLMQAKVGWTPASRKAVLDWLNTNKTLRGGRLVNLSLTGYREDFAASFSDQERQQFAKELEQLALPATETGGESQLVIRPALQDWTLDGLIEALDALPKKAGDREKGQKLLSEAHCLRCHQFGGRGSHIAPDLTNVGKRFDRRALLESIIHPSLQIDPKYTNAVYEMEDGQVISGRAAGVSRDQITVEVDQLTGKTVAIKRAEIVETRQSPVSPMPTGLLNGFTVEEIADLLSYLRQADR